MSDKIYTLDEIKAIAHPIAQRYGLLLCICSALMQEEKQRRKAT